MVEKSGAGDWGTDELTKTLKGDTPKQGITIIGAKNKERKESVELSEAALLENLSAWRDAGIDADVAKKVLKGYVYSNKPTFEPVTRPKASEVSDGDLFAGKDSSGNSVVVFKKPYEGMYMSGKPFYIRVDKNGTTNTDSIQKAFSGLKGPYVKLGKTKYSFDDGNTRKSTGGQSVDQAKAQWGRDPLAGQTPMSGWATYMNKTFMPKLKPKLDSLVDEIYANLRKLPKDLDRYNRKAGLGWMQNSSQREDAVKLASAIETIAEKGFSDKTIEDYLQSVGKRSGGFGSYYTNKKNFKQAMAEPMGRQKFAKFLLDSAKDLHNEVMDMVRNASDAGKAEKKLRGESVLESIELDEGTLAAEDPNIVDTLLAAVKNKLLRDLEQGNVKDANEVAKLVKMTIEKDYKHKGYSRLKRK